MKPILLVEDNEDDAFFMKRALRDAGVENSVVRIEDGQQAINYLSGTGDYSNRDIFPLPSIMLLDLKLPFKNGHEVLEWLRSQPNLRTLVVIILSSSSEPVDLRRAYGSGVNSYVVKPATATQLTATARAFKNWWLGENKFVECLST